MKTNIPEDGPQIQQFIHINLDFEDSKRVQHLCSGLWDYRAKDHNIKDNLVNFYQIFIQIKADRYEGPNEKLLYRLKSIDVKLVNQVVCPMGMTIPYFLKVSDLSIPRSKKNTVQIRIERVDKQEKGWDYKFKKETFLRREAPIEIVVKEKGQGGLSSDAFPCRI